MKVVKILWEDSCNSNLNWVIKEDVEVELVNIDSFGVVVKETDEFVSIAQNYGSEPEQFSNIVTIPRGCIKEIFVIHDDNYVRQGEPKPALAKVGEDGSMDKSWHPKKQGEQKVIIPKFRVGDKIKLSCEPKYPAREIVEIKDNAYYFDSLVHLPIEKQNEWELVEQKPAWSEEDEKFFKTALWHISNSISNGKRTDIHCDTTDWLKNLKDRVQSKQEWSEEDEKRIEQICSDLKCGMINFYANEGVKGLHYKEIIESNIECLKSLRPQNTWKPSEEQMQVLQWCMPLWSEPKTKAVLESLIADLKKLKS